MNLRADPVPVCSHLHISQHSNHLTFFTDSYSETHDSLVEPQSPLKDVGRQVFVTVSALMKLGRLSEELK